MIGGVVIPVVPVRCAPACGEDAHQVLLWALLAIAVVVGFALGWALMACVLDWVERRRR